MTTLYMKILVYPQRQWCTLSSTYETRERALEEVERCKYHSCIVWLSDGSLYLDLLKRKE